MLKCWNKLERADVRCHKRMNTLPELSIKFDLALARRLAAFSLRAYAESRRVPVSSPSPPPSGGEGRGEEAILNSPSISNPSRSHASPLPSSPLNSLPRRLVAPKRGGGGSEATAGRLKFLSTNLLMADIGDAIVLAFRGTKDARDWLTDVDFLKCRMRIGECSRLDRNGLVARSTRTKIEVHEGFWRAANSLLPKIIGCLNRPDAGSAPKPLLLTGHSLGGALAVLAAFNLLEAGFVIRAVYTFGSPRVGNAAWRKAYHSAGGCRQVAGHNRPIGRSTQSRSLGAKTFRLAAAGDLVPLLPGLVDGYRHVGQEVFLKGQGEKGMGEIKISPSHLWEILCDEVRAFHALERLDLDFILKFHSIEHDYLPLLGMTPDPHRGSGRKSAPVSPPFSILHPAPSIFVSCFPHLAFSVQPSALFLSQASPSNSQIGLFVVCAAILIGLVATLISIAGYFATRREVDDLKDRVGALENLMETRTEKLHRRINRLLAGQMLIAGQVGVALEHHRGELDSLIRQIEHEED